MRARPPSPPQRTARSPSRQRGVALIIALVLLVIMTLLGLSAMRNVTLEEKMAGQTYDRSLSFQATEAALRQAEAYVGANKPVKSAGDACDTAGVCGRLTSGTLDRWADSSFTGWVDATAVSSSSVSITPQFIIEYLGNTFPCVPNDLSQGSDCKRYRITARSNAGDGRAGVMLQSTYATD